MKGKNLVILVGRVGKDPESRSAGEGVVVNLSVATSHNVKSGDKWEERTEWHRVVLFGRLAEIAAQYLKKGSQVYIEGSLRTSKYTDKSGIERFSTDIIAKEMQLLGKRDAEPEPPKVTSMTSTSWDDSEIPF